MSAPLLLAAMLIERRSQRPAPNRHLLARFAVAVIAGCTVLAMSAPSRAGVERPVASSKARTS
jgi:hypothetical protein